MNEILIDFYQQTIPAENHDLIPLQMICELFNIDLKSESKKIETNKYYKSNFSLLANEILFGDNKKRLHLERKAFIRWVIQLNPNTVDNTLREDFIEYQNNIVDYLFENANQHEAILKKSEELKRKKNEIYNILAKERPDFVEFINIGAEIARLGIDNKTIQKKIAGNQTSLNI